jgi:hypothetical protein
MHVSAVRNAVGAQRSCDLRYHERANAFSIQPISWLGTANAFAWGMSIRSFRARNGSTWTVSRIESSARVLVPGAPREWLAFQDESGTDRRRVFNVPPNWEDLSDERLDLLRRYAEPSRFQPRATPPFGTSSVSDTDVS